MNKLIETEDVVAVIKSFLDINTGDEATENLILAIGAELLDVSADTVNEMIQSRQVVEASDMKITGATLLSIEEAETLLTQQERNYDKDWWWLRSPGYFFAYAAFADYGGDICDYGGNVNYAHGCVRPALKIDISNSDIKVGDVFEFGGKEFKVISPKLAWMYKDDIGHYAFREDWKTEDVNKYEASDVKKYVDTWFESAKN